MFLFLGLTLLLLAFASLLIKVEINVRTLDFPKHEDFPLGFFFAPVLANYGLVSLALGTAETSMPNRRRLGHLLPVFATVYVFTGVTAWLATRLGFYDSFWWVYAGIQSVPSIIVTAAGAIQLFKKEKLNRVLQNYRVRGAVFIALTAIPLLFVASLWLLFLSP